MQILGVNVQGYQFWTNRLRKMDEQIFVFNKSKYQLQCSTTLWMEHQQITI